jgi:pSer/pThr/pTyr-binding forkhead associated (FHA) protein
MGHANDDDKTRALDARDSARETACPYCSATIPHGADYCPSCGYEPGSMGEGGSAPAATAVAGVVEVTAAGESFGIGEGEHILGRSEGDLVVSNPYLSRKHLVFSVRGGRVFVKDLGSTNGTFVDGTKLGAQEERELHQASELKAGELPISMRWFGEPGRSDEAPIVEDAPEAEIPGLREDSIDVVEVRSPWSLKAGEIEYPLPFGKVRIGRKPDRNDIAFPDDGFISAAHAVLDVDLDYLKGQDIGSTNGTLLNGEKLAANDWRDMKAGDEFTVGKTALIVVRTEPEAVQADEPPADAPTEEPQP